MFIVIYTITENLTPYPIRYYKNKLTLFGKKLFFIYLKIVIYDII